MQPAQKATCGTLKTVPLQCMWRLCALLSESVHDPLCGRGQLTVSYSAFQLAVSMQADVDCKLVPTARSSIAHGSEDGEGVQVSSAGPLKRSSIPPRYIAPPWSAALPHAASVTILHEGSNQQRPPVPTWPYPPVCKPPTDSRVKELGNLCSEGCSGTQQCAVCTTSSTSADHRSASEHGKSGGQFYDTLRPAASMSHCSHGSHLRPACKATVRRLNFSFSHLQLGA
jgi:hypothetical protein